MINWAIKRYNHSMRIETLYKKLNHHYPSTGSFIKDVSIRGILNKYVSCYRMTDDEILERVREEIGD